MPAKYNASGRFGSKFVTVIVTGDASSSVALQCYQASNQAMALVRGPSRLMIESEVICCQTTACCPRSAMA